MPALLSALPGAAAALGGVLGLIWLAAWLAQRTGLAPRARPARAGADAAGLVLEASLALDPRRRVHVLRLGARRVLLLTGGPGDVLLGWEPVGWEPVGWAPVGWAPARDPGPIGAPGPMGGPVSAGGSARSGSPVPAAGAAP